MDRHRVDPPMWRDPLAYVAALLAPGFTALVWVAMGWMFEPDVPWPERALSGAILGLVMVLVAIARECWRVWRQKWARHGS